MKYKVNEMDHFLVSNKIQYFVSKDKPYKKYTRLKSFNVTKIYA